MQDIVTYICGNSDMFTVRTIIGLFVFVVLTSAVVSLFDIVVRSVRR